MKIKQGNFIDDYELVQAKEKSVVWFGVSQITLLLSGVSLTGMFFTMKNESWQAPALWFGAFIFLIAMYFMSTKFYFKYQAQAVNGSEDENEDAE